MVRDQAGADGEIAFLQQFSQLDDVHTVRCDTIGIKQNPDLSRIDTFQCHSRDTLETLQTPLEIAIEHVVGVGKIATFRGDAQDQDGLIRSRSGKNKNPLQIVRQFVAN